VLSHSSLDQSPIQHVNQSEGVGRAVFPLALLREESISLLILVAGRTQFPTVGELRSLSLLAVSWRSSPASGDYHDPLLRISSSICKVHHDGFNESLSWIESSLPLPWSQLSEWLLFFFERCMWLHWVCTDNLGSATYFKLYNHNSIYKIPFAM
jgi:hypothetical protein